MSPHPYLSVYVGGARLPSASISTSEDFLSTHGWVGIHTFQGQPSTLTNGSQWINVSLARPWVAELWGWVCSSLSPGGLSAGRPQWGPTLLLIGPFPPSLQGAPHSPSNPCLRTCIWGTQAKTKRSRDRKEGAKRLWLLLPLFTRAEPTPVAPPRVPLASGAGHMATQVDFMILSSWPWVTSTHHPPEELLLRPQSAICPCEGQPGLRGREPRGPCWSPALPWLPRDLVSSSAKRGCRCHLWEVTSHNRRAGNATDAWCGFGGGGDVAGPHSPATLPSQGPAGHPGVSRGCG